MQLQKSLVLITKYILLVMLFNLINLFKILIVTKKEQLEVSWHGFVLQYNTSSNSKLTLSGDWLKLQMLKFLNSSHPLCRFFYIWIN